MINILPPDIKEQLRYSRYNVILRRYLFLVLFLVGILTALLWFASSYAEHEVAAYRQVVAEKQQHVARYDHIKNEVSEFKSKLKVIKELFNTSTKFSLLLEDIAAVLPSGSYITSISLTGEDKKPLNIIITVDSLTKAGVIRNALLQSERISSVDIQSIAKNEDSNTYVVDVIIAFKEGQAR